MDEEWFNCNVCGEAFGLQPETVAVLRRSEQVFYCPWGHELVMPDKAVAPTDGRLTVIQGGKK
jgi:hypothetical protein